MKYTVILLAIVLSGCAGPQPQRLAATKWPEVVIAADRATVHDILVGGLASGDVSIENATPNMLQMRMTDGNAAMTKAFFGCAACADPYIRLNFILSEVSEGTKVVAQYWRVVPKFGGAEDRMSMDRSDDFNDVQKILWELRDAAM